MPYPYSDNLYSMVDDDSDELDDEPIDTNGLYQPEQHPHQGYGQGEASGTAAEDYLSPTDGYFLAASHNTESEWLSSTSANVPHVPSVLVTDPSLEQGSTAESKAREADQERILNTSSGEHAGLDDPFRAAADSTRNNHSGILSAYGHSSSASNSSRATHHQPSSGSSAYAPSTANTSFYTRTYAPTRRPAYHEGRPSFLLRDEAPPAYTPSPTTSPTSPTHSRNYSTFSAATTQIATAAGRMGRRDEESLGLLAGEPESMGGNPNGEHSDEGWTHVWREHLKRRLPYLNWRSGKMILLGVVLLLVATGFLVSFITGLKEGKEQDRLRDPPDRDPVLKEPTPTPQDPDSGQPNMSYPELDDALHWRAKHACKDAQVARASVSYDVSFSSERKFLFIQDVDSDRHPGGRDIQVQGDIIFRRTGSGTPGPSVVLEVVVNDDRINVAIEWDSNSQSMLVRAPRVFPWDDTSSSPCVAIKATIWVPADGVLDSLSVQAIHLGIRLMDNLSLKVAQRAWLHSVVGYITAASTGSDTRDEGIIGVGAPDSWNFESRFIEVKTTSAPIRGSWPLYDYLGLQSTAGTIRVCIEPKEADKEQPKPAILYVKSMSGDVEFREPIHAAQEAFGISERLTPDQQIGLDLKAEAVLPPRDYRVDVHTTSGDIRGAVAFSSAAQFKTTSGDISVELLPVLDESLSAWDSKKVFLGTGSTSGSTAVSVLDPLWVDSSAQGVGRYTLVQPTEGGEASVSGGGSAMLRCLYSTHSTTSANIRLHYPGTWEGEVSLASITGKLTASGKDLRVIKAGDDWPGINKNLVARKPGDLKNGGGQVTAKSTSGDVEFLVGEPDWYSS
ncbi:hypothetical protein QBC46DRAFT_338530 [Diplogelasinospora grovesii]|uniref:Uncharacterized protein n=1 Tax=Diplogelasinospora grovesii TaxID=303347 RepID=A0AAN6ND41_9PEZI|nr:hypothetical protein QBC46DRAFT_338530 [Diplogelasinospora grovesii]